MHEVAEGLVDSVFRTFILESLTSNVRIQNVTELIDIPLGTDCINLRPYKTVLSSYELFLSLYVTNYKTFS